MGLGAILDRFWGGKSTKLDQKSIKKWIKNKMRFGIDFGWLLDRFLIGFWAQVGGQVGAKLAPKSEKWEPQDDVNKYTQK